MGKPTVSVAKSIPVRVPDPIAGQVWIILHRSKRAERCGPSSAPDPWISVERILLVSLKICSPVKCLENHICRDMAGCPLHLPEVRFTFTTAMAFLVVGTLAGFWGTCMCTYIGKNTCA